MGCPSVVVRVPSGKCKDYVARLREQGYVVKPGEHTISIRFGDDVHMIPTFCVVSRETQRAVVEIFRNADKEDTMFDQNEKLDMGFSGGPIEFSRELYAALFENCIPPPEILLNN